MSQAILNYILDQQDKPKEETMILAFKPQFVEPILLGTKIHTIRLAKEGRWIPGRKIQFATGVRTKNYHCFKEDECVSTQKVLLSLDPFLGVQIDGRELGYQEKFEFAQNDGFENFEDFHKWFAPLIEKEEDLMYLATIIHWTDKRY